jgi:hypothetical protein
MPNEPPTSRATTRMLAGGWLNSFASPSRIWYGFCVLARIWIRPPATGSASVMRGSIGAAATREMP